ncbi:MAG: GNAT family N-acetyltransferase [Blautia sp.]
MYYCNFSTKILRKKREIIRKGRLGEGKRVRDFADMCFFTETSEERFETLLPKLYGEPEKTVKDHILLENDGRLKGLILPQTMIWKAGDRELLTGHIGTVCVSPDYRERGAMSRLMKTAVEELEKAGCVCIVLNGQRQRYEHYGFVPTGGKIQFVFRPANVKEEQAEGYELREFTQEDLEEIEKLFCKNVLHMKRKKRDFSEILRSWSAQPLVLWNKDNKICGYCTVVSQEKKAAIAELRLTDEKHLKPFLKCLFKKGFSQTVINIAPGTEEYAEAESLCEYYNILPCFNIRILQFAPLVEALLEQKSRRIRLPLENVKLLIEGYGLLEITAAEKGVKAWKSEKKEDEADMKLSYEQAVHLLFSPLSSKREQLSGQWPPAENWFPLPLYIEENDCI